MIDYDVIGEPHHHFQDPRKADGKDDSKAKKLWNEYQGCFRYLSDGLEYRYPQSDKQSNHENRRADLCCYKKRQSD